jgi:hypothetical protein
MNMSLMEYVNSLNARDTRDDDLLSDVPLAM